MAIPASFSFTCLCHHIIDPSGLNQFGVQLLVATDAIVHDDLRTGILRHDNLWLAKGDEGGHVFHSVHAFKYPVFREILMRHVTIVAGRIAAV